jgi:hypothetical protein
MELPCHDVQSRGQMLTLGFQSGLRAMQLTNRHVADGGTGRPAALPLDG